MLVANKTDLASDDDKTGFEHLLNNSQPAKAASAWITQGEVDIALLAHSADEQRLAVHPHAHDHHHKQDSGLDSQTPPQEGEEIRTPSNHGQGHISLGWLISGAKTSRSVNLRECVTSLEQVR